MSFRRSDRVAQLLQRELGMLVSEELRDPRIVFPTVTEVELSGDLRVAKVFVSVLGDEEVARGTLAALREATPFIRHRLGERTDLRFVPALEFVADRSALRATRISALLRETRGDRAEGE